MLEVKRPENLKEHIGAVLGPSKWLVVTQEIIGDFARISGDHNWIHIDEERAKKELPDGKTIAHGWLTLSFVTALGMGMLSVRERGKGINYGAERIRFIEPVQCGDRIRLHRKIQDVSPKNDGWKITYENTIEIEGRERPAMSAVTISIIYNAGA